jgi:hypothetical protein
MCGSASYIINTKENRTMSNVTSTVVTMPCTTIQATDLEETELIDLAQLDEMELEDLPAEILLQHVTAFPMLHPQLWSLIERVWHEQSSRCVEDHGSTHASIPARYVSNRALRDLYYTQRAMQEETTLVYPEDLGDENAMQRYRKQHDAIAVASKTWPVYRVLEGRGAPPALYLLSKLHQKNSYLD